MSYDLDLHPRPGQALGRDRVLAHFTDRPGYTIDGDEVNYHNEETGVYFSFRYSPASDEPVDEDEPNRGTQKEHVWFNMNYFRPHFFGLEAADELDDFVQALDLTVSDPQAEGMGEGEFSREGFLRGWNAGNRFAHQASAQMESQGEHALGGSLTL